MLTTPPEFARAPVVSDILGTALDASTPTGLYMEFGVYNGRSLRAIRKILSPDITLYGFDSFEGLPEAWNGFRAGTFATSVRPKLPNTQLVVGQFSDTLPAFVRGHPEHASFIHIDCDLYSSTWTVLEAFAEKIIPGTIILFDEIFGFAGYQDHEYRAFKQFVADFGKRFEPIARWEAYRAAIRIT